MSGRDRILIVGPGRSGLALGYALAQAEALDDLTFAGRSPDPPSHPLFTQGIASYTFGLEPPPTGTTALFLAVPDDALQAVAVSVAKLGQAPPSCAAFHLSGALSAEVLGPLHDAGYHVGTFHPLQALANPITGADRLPGSYVAISGDATARAAARRLLQWLGCHELAVPVAMRPVYHAAAVVSSNYLAALVALGARLLVRAGIAYEDALPAILPLAQGTLENVRELGIGGALTGPILRGDVDTLRLHLQSLEGREREMYRALGLELSSLGLEWGLEEETAETIRDLLEGAQEER